MTTTTRARYYPRVPTTTIRATATVTWSALATVGRRLALALVLALLPLFLVSDARGATPVFTPQAVALASCVHLQYVNPVVSAVPVVGGSPVADAYHAEAVPVA